MSTCISLHGEYSEHVLPGTKFSEFDCDRCYAFAEDAALAEVERLRAKVARIEALAEEFLTRARSAELDTDRATSPEEAAAWAVTADVWREAADEVASMAALAEPERDEEGGNG